MIDQILTALEGGSADDVPEMAAALEDEAFRRDLVTAAFEKFNLGEMVELDGPEIAEALSSSAATREFLAGMAMMLSFGEMMEAGLEPAPFPVDTKVDDRPAPADVAPAVLEEGIERLARSFFVETCFGDSVSIEADGFVLPNFEMASLEVEWTGVAGPDGPIALGPARPAFGDGRLDPEGRLRLDVALAEPAPDGKIVTATGRCRIAVPVRIASLAFDAADVGETRQAGDVSATLRTCDNDCVTVDIAGLDDDAAHTILARDAVGRRIRQTEMQSMGGASRTTSIRFTGTVDAVEVFIAVESAAREIDVVATREPASDFEGTETPAASRYQPPRPPFEFANLGSEDLSGGFEIVAGRHSAAFEFNQPEIHAHLPRVDNSALAKVDFDDVEAVDGNGGAIACEVAHRGYRADAHCRSISFEGEDYDTPVELASARGRSRVTYPILVETVTATPGASSDDGVRVRIDGPKVTIGLDVASDSPFDLPWLADRARDDSRVLEALDASGRALRPLSWQSWSDDELSLAYWGEPTSVRVVVPRKWVTEETSFDVEPAPLLPEEARGSTGAHGQCRKP